MNSDAMGAPAVTVGEPATHTTTETRRKQPVQPLEWTGVLARSGYVFGVDISGEGERVVLSNLSGQVLGQSHTSANGSVDSAGLSSPATPDEVVARVAGMMKSLLDEKSIRPREVLRAAVGFGGPVDALKGHVRASHEFAGWEEYPLASRLESALDVPTYLDNDARLAALGEVWFGSGRNTAECDLVYLHWSTGVGGGIVTDGRLVRGAATIAGEVGHTVVRTGPDALACRCGGRGHLEAYVRGPALLARARSAAGEGAVPNVQALFAQEASSPALAALVDEAVEMLGVTLANLITQVNPNMVVIGGQVARQAVQALPRVADLALSLAMPVSVRNVQIVPAALGEDATVMGAIALALDTLR